MRKSWLLPQSDRARCIHPTICKRWNCRERNKNSNNSNRQATAAGGETLTGSAVPALIREEDCGFSQVGPAKATRRRNHNARMAQPKPCPVVLPIPHCHRTEISAKSHL